MFECNAKKILARRVFKIFSEVITFLVERFTALTFLFRFCVKTKMKGNSSISRNNILDAIFDRPRMTPSKFYFNKKQESSS